MSFRNVLSAAQEAFVNTITQAQDSGTDSGDLAATEYGETGGTATFTKSRYRVKPSNSDFVIDVQNTARKALTTVEFKYFMRNYLGSDPTGIADMNDPLDLTPDGKDKYFEKLLQQYPEHNRVAITVFDHNLRIKLGKAFREFGVYPTSDYFNDGNYDIRIPAEERKPKANASTN